MDDLLTDILRINDLGVTSARLIILEFLFTAAVPFIEISQILKIDPEHISRTTLYRTLISFCDVGLLYKIVDNKNKVIYGIGEKLSAYLKLSEHTSKDNYHFQCKKCGRIFCLPIKIPSISLPEGFIKTESHLLLSGECNSCTSRKHIKLSR